MFFLYDINADTDRLKLLQTEAEFAKERIEMAARVTPPIRVASGTGKPKFNNPRVKTSFNKKGMMTKTVKKMNRRLGAR